MGANKRYKIALIISIVGILSIFTGSTYALFSKTVNSSKIQVVKTGKVKVDIVETQGNLSLTNFTTMEDSEGLVQEESYSFSLKNSGDANATIKVMLVDADTNTLDPKNVRVGLEVNNTETGPMNLYEVERVINQGTLLKGATNTYKLRLWVDNAKADTIDTLVDQTVSYKLKIMAEQKF